MDEVKKEFGQIYDENVDKVYRFIFLKVNSKETAEDLTAETFAKTWRAFKESRLESVEIRNPRALCYKTARNLVIDHYRRKGKNQLVPIESVSLPDPKNQIEANAAISSDMEMVMKAIGKIKGDYQDVIIWHYLDELSVPEISDLLNKSENNTRVMIHRALNSLKKAIQG